MSRDINIMTSMVAAALDAWSEHICCDHQQQAALALIQMVGSVLRSQGQDFEVAVEALQEGYDSFTDTAEHPKLKVVQLHSQGDNDGE